MNEKMPIHTQEHYSTLFGHLVVQQSNMAQMLMGKVAHPETGQTFKDLDAARLFIDQLEMIEVKTKGNLTPEESGLLKQSLMALRLAFVEAVDSSPSGSVKSPGPTPAPQPAPESPVANPVMGGSAEEHRAKFSKKY